MTMLRKFIHAAGRTQADLLQLLDLCGERSNQICLLLQRGKLMMTDSATYQRYQRD